MAPETTTAKAKTERVSAARWVHGTLFKVAIICACAVPAVATGQSSGATIVGTVRDPAGMPVSGATIVLQNLATGMMREAESGDAGQYLFAGVVPSVPLSLLVRRDGFRAARREVAAVAAGERRLVDVHLQLEGVSDAVQVTADSAIGRTASPELGGTLPRSQLDRLPVNGRDLLALAYLVPGAAPARGFYNLAPRLTINGASSLATNYTIDGFDNTDLFLGGWKIPVTIGSTENLNVLVNAYSPEYGRTGNGVFAVTTRSGTNRHAGEVLYLTRPGAALDSPNFFAPRDQQGEVLDDNFRRNQVGGSVGGPLRANRLFYFSDAEVTRERQDAVLTSALAVGLAPTRFHSQTGVGKVDGHWNSRHSTTIRYHVSDYTHDDDVGFVGGLTLPSAGLEVNYRNQFASVTHRTVGRTAVNELGVQAGRLRADWRSADAGPRTIVTDRGATLAVLGSVSDNFFWTETDVQIRNTYSFQTSRHAMKVGGDLLHGDFFIDSGPGARGSYVVDLQGRSVSPIGSFVSRADLPHDVAVLSYSQTFGNPEVVARQLLAALFAEDTFRASANITLTLGVRWDYDSVTNTPVGAGDFNNVAPRLGLSWTPRGSLGHQIRAGYGIFYERIPFAVHSDTVFNNPEGGAVAVTFAPGTPFAPPVFPNALPADAIEGLPVSQLPPRNVQIFDPHLRSPWTEQISGGYLFSVTRDFSVGVDYVHSRSRNVIRRVDINAPDSVAAGTMRSVADADAARPHSPRPGGFRLIEQDQSSGRSTFDGLYINARKRFSGNVAFDAAYTLSRTENNSDDINFRPVDSRAPDAERGPSLNDRRHVFALNGLVRVSRLFDVTPIVFLSSGQPLNVTTGRDDNGDTVFNDRPPGISRNSERTSGFAQFDLGVVRRFRVGKTTFEARAEVFNVFNRTNFSGFFNYGASGVRPDEQGTLAFQPTQAGPARQFQFLARVLW